MWQRHLKKCELIVVVVVVAYTANVVFALLEATAAISV